MWSRSVLYLAFRGLRYYIHFIFYSRQKKVIKSSTYFVPTYSQQQGGGDGKSNAVWARGGKVSIPAEVAAHLTNRDHLEAIHEHLRYIYDRLDDLLDRVHYLETKDRN